MMPIVTGQNVAWIFACIIDSNGKRYKILILWLQLYDSKTAIVRIIIITEYSCGLGLE